MKQCTCKICRYHREFEKHLETIPEESKQFFKDLFDRYSMAEEEREWLGYKIDDYRKRLEKAIETKGNL